MLNRCLLGSFSLLTFSHLILRWTLHVKRSGTIILPEGPEEECSHPSPETQASLHTCCCSYCSSCANDNRGETNHIWVNISEGTSFSSLISYDSHHWFIQVRRADRVCSLGSVTWGTHLLEGTLIFNAFGSNKNPAVSEGQLLHRWAPQLLKQPPSLIVHPVTKGELKVNIGFLKKRRRQVLYK